MSACCIRRASTSDLPRVLADGCRFYQEGCLPGRFVLSKAIATWTRFIDYGIGVIFWLEQANESLGALGAVLVPDPNDGAMIAHEMFWWVQPESRGKGLALFNAFEAWAIEAGADRASMVHLINLSPKPLEKLYTRRGYKPTEVFYHKEIK